MSFDLLERSRFSGRPVHLFIFQRQGLIWRFAGGDRDVVVGSNTYLAANIARTEIEQTAERAKDTIKITFPYVLNPAATEFPPTQSLGDVWRPYIPSDPVTVTCLATHYGDTDPPVVQWMGEVVGPEFTDTGVTLSCDPGHGGEARNQGAKFQRACWKTVYSTGIRGCNLDPETVRVEGEITSVTGLAVEVAEFAGSAFGLRGGTIYWTRDDGVVEERPIMGHDGDTVDVLYSGAGLQAGREVSALPGCAGNWAACAALRPDPELHYGGAIYKPVKNPLDGVSMSWG